MIEIREHYNIDPDKSISNVASVTLSDFMSDSLTSYQDADAKDQKVLIVNFAASHTGRVNKNFVFYNAEKAQKSLGSWISPYPKPIIKHHMDGPGMFGGGDPAGYDPIGRILDATWEPNSRQEPDKGDGWVKIKAAITDPDAIQKFLDKRYLTVSIGYRTDDVTCNICGANPRTNDGKMCEHLRGQEYTVEEGEDSKKVMCIWTIGEYEGKELSVVNLPADSQAMANSMELATADILQSIGMKISDAVSTADGKFDFEHIDSEITSIFNVKESEEDEENWEEYSEEERKQIAEELDRVYDELSEIMETEAADAKLSTEQRKKLKNSTFCGPNRSFPVPDCAHVTAARRLIGRAKVSDSTKAKILACVNRKSKSLGCDSKESACAIPDNMADMISQITTLNDAIAAMRNEAAETQKAHVLELAEKENTIRELKVAVSTAEKNVNVFHEWGQSLSDDIASIRKATKTSEQENLKKIASLVAGISMLSSRFESSEKAEAELRAKAEQLSAGNYTALMEAFDEQLGNVIKLMVSDVAPGAVTHTITDSLQTDNTIPHNGESSKPRQSAGIRSLRRKYVGSDNVTKRS